jgi:hypothetical protein
MIFYPNTFFCIIPGRFDMIARLPGKSKTVLSRQRSLSNRDLCPFAVFHFTTGPRLPSVSRSETYRGARGWRGINLCYHYYGCRHPRSLRYATGHRVVAKPPYRDGGGTQQPGPMFADFCIPGRFDTIAWLPGKSKTVVSKQRSLSNRGLTPF